MFFVLFPTDPSNAASLGLGADDRRALLRSHSGLVAVLFCTCIDMHDICMLFFTICRDEGGVFWGGLFHFLQKRAVGASSGVGKSSSAEEALFVTVCLLYVLI